MISRSKYRSSAEVCADCGASDPTWASINRGLLLCAECCSVHRSMGRHISHIKSLRQGTWPPSLLAMIQTATAQNVNCIWEHSLLDTSAPKHLRKKPQPKDPLHPTKWEFIQSKHLRLAYVLRARRDEPVAELGRQLHGAVRSASLDTALRLLAQGADPNYYHPEKGSTCLHAASRAGQSAQVELLVSWGASPAAVDHAHDTPADTARAGGHAELSSRLTALMYEAVDRLRTHLTGTCTANATATGSTTPTPTSAMPAAAPHPHHMTDGAKAARGKLQLLPNHLFEELVMDIYDEVDRRETEAMWQREAVGVERCGVAFLPVNPALSAPRNQGRQKLARLARPELTAILSDVLSDASRRQHLASLRPHAHTHAHTHTLQPSDADADDEPLYDSVASDDDYALPPTDRDISKPVPRAGEPVSPSYSPGLPSERPAPLPAHRPSAASASHAGHDIETLRKELNSRDSTISSLKLQLKTLQGIVDQLTRENSVLKSSSVEDEHSLASQPELEVSELSPCLAPSSPVTERTRATRGHSLDTDPTHMSPHDAHARDARDVDTERIPEPRIQEQASECNAKPPARPVSMFESTERHDNDWQASVGPLASEVEARAEALTRCVGLLWAAARERAPLPPVHHIQAALDHLLQLFPMPYGDQRVSMALSSLRSASLALRQASEAASPLQGVRVAAYDLAKATKTLVTHFQPTPPS